MNDLHADDIAWGLPSTPHPEQMPPQLLAALSHADLLDYAYRMQDDVEALRLTLQEAVAALSTVVRDRDRLRGALRGRR